MTAETSAADTFPHVNTKKMHKGAPGRLDFICAFNSIIVITPVLCTLGLGARLLVSQIHKGRV